MESAITVRKVRVERSLAGRPTVRRGKEGTFFFDNQLPGSRFPSPIISPAQPHCGNECYSLLLLRYLLRPRSAELLSLPLLGERGTFRPGYL